MKPFVSHRALNVLSIFLPVVLGLLLYKDALGLLLYYDDVQLMWVEQHSFGFLLTSAAGMPIYRPLPMVLWKALRLLLGGYDPTVLHALNLLSHALNTCLMWALAYRMFRRESFALLAALIFTAFPFSYEAVAWITAFFHPLVTTFLLMSFLLYLEYRQRAQRWALAGSLLLFWSALATHENAFVFPLIILGWELAESLRHRQPIRRWIALYWAEAGVFFGISLLVLAQSRFAGLPSLDGFISDALFILQGWFFPLAYYARDLAARLHWPPTSALLALSALFIAILVVVAWRTKRLNWLFRIGVWIVVPMLPVIFLDPHYVLYGWRFFYLSAVGIALAWAFLLWAMLDWMRRWLPAALLAVPLYAAVSLLIAQPSLSVLSCNLDAYKAVAEMLAGIERAAKQTPPDRTLAFVNLPLYTVSLGERGPGCVNPFPYGVSGIIVIPPYPHWVDDYLALRGLPRAPVKTMRVEEFFPNWVTYGDTLGVGELKDMLRDGSAAYLFDLGRWRFFDLSAHWQVAARAEQANGDAPALWDDVLALVNHQMALKEGKLAVDLRWRALQSPQRYYTVFVHVWNGHGKVLAQDDAMPATNYIPTIFWGAGDEILDRHTVVLPADLPPDHYWVAVGVYDTETHERLPATNAARERYQGDLYIIGEFDYP